VPGDDAVREAGMGPTPAAPVEVPASAKEMLSGVGDAFVENQGQLEDSGIRFYAQGGGVSIGLTDDGIVVAMEGRPLDGMEDATPGSVGVTSPSATHFAVKFDGCRAVAPHGRDMVDRISSYFLGNDPSRWVRDARAFREVFYEGLWEGVDLVLRLRGDALKYDIMLGAGADASDVAFRYEGVLGLSMDALGDLIVRTDAGELRDGRPVVFQEGVLPDAGAGGRFTLLGGGRVGFGLPDGCVPGRPVLIDPGLVFSTFLGGSGDDSDRGPTLDAAGNILVCGVTNSPDFPTTNGSYDPEGEAGAHYDGFIARFDPEGVLLDSTYVGGSRNDEIEYIRVAQDGDVYAVGITSSSDFPVTADALQSGLRGIADGFILEISGDLSGLTYGTYLGGTGEDFLAHIGLDPSGNVCVSGVTTSPDIPTTPGAFCATYEGAGLFMDTVIVYKLDGDLSSVLYCTYVNGVDTSVPFNWAGNPPYIFLGQSVDSNGDILLAGRTCSTALPTTPGAFQPTYSGGSLDAFALKLRPMGAGASDLIACTYLGGSGTEEAINILALEDGRVAVVGDTNSADLPRRRALDDTVEWVDGFLMVLDGNLTALEYSTFLGGSMADLITSVVEARGGGLLYLMGSSASDDLVGTKGSFDSLFHGDLDFFIASIDVERSRIEYFTWIGGRALEGLSTQGNVLAITGDGELIAVGRTRSTDFPTTAGAEQERFGGGDSDGFLLRLDPVPCGLPDPPRNLSATPGNGTVSLRWDPHTNVGYSVQGYRVHRGTAPGEWDLNRTLAGTATGLTDAGLTNGVRYYYGVSTLSSMGEGPPGLVNATPPAPPSAPGMGLATGDGNVTVNWSAPSDPGGDLFGYRLLRGPSLDALGLLLETGASTLTYLDWNVTRGELYFYAVLAFNGAGNGTMAWGSMTPCRPPGPPTSFDLAPHDGWIRVTWNVPQDRGGLPLKGYRVYMREEGTDDWRAVEVDNTHLMYDDRRVENGRRYHYRVTALTGSALTEYEGRATAERSEVPFGPPTAPAGLVAVPGDSQVGLEWNASFENGRRITNYTIRWGTSSGELHRTVEIGNRTGHVQLVEGNGITYYFQVAARNLAGPGPWSPEARATPLGVPSEVRNLRANMTLEGVVITWDAPDDSGGAEELSYRLSRTGPGGTVVVLRGAMTETTLTDGTAMAGAAYRYSVHTSNALSTGPSVEVEVVVIRPPTAVMDLAASLGDRAIGLSWGPPESDGGSDVTIYFVYRRGPTGGYVKLDWTVLMNYTDTDLVPGTEYRYHVTAKNDRFEGIEWTDVNATAITHPGPVLELRTVYRDGAVELSWSPPDAQWGAMPTGYKVLRGTTLANLVVVATLGPDLTYRDGTVQRERMYYYQVVATSAVGDGEAGNVREVQAGVPGPSPSMMWLAAVAAVAMAVLIAMVVVYGRRARAAARGVPTVHLVEEVLVVLRDGRLVATSGREEGRSRDPELMTGMLTAIQGFAKEGLERGGTLRSISYEDNTILMASGERLYVAAVVFGQPDDALRGVIEETVRELEATYGDIIDGWDGDLSVFAGVVDVIRPVVERTRHVTREDVKAAGAAPGGGDGTGP